MKNHSTLNLAAVTLQLVTGALGRRKGSEWREEWGGGELPWF